MANIIDAIISAVGVVITLIFPHLYGVVENRLFKECGTTIPGGHFKWYHVYLFGIFVGNAYMAFALTHNWLFGVAIFVLSPLALDWVWWIIRYYDFKKDPAGAPSKYNGETNQWHQQSDWDNYGGLPLYHNVYVWWYVFAILSAVLFLACPFVPAI